MYEKELAEMRERMIRETEEFLSRRLKGRQMVGSKEGRQLAGAALELAANTSDYQCRQACAIG